MPKKKALIITSYYPPQGGPGCIKLVKHLKYFNDDKWEPIILTQKYNAFFAFDESLVEQVKGIKVYNFFSPDFGWVMSKLRKGKNITTDRRWLKSNEKVSFSQRVQKFIWRHILIPDGKIGWVIPLVLKALKVIKKEKPDVVYVRVPVWSLSIASALISKLSKVPVILDFDDEWAGDFNDMVTFTKLRRNIEKYLEKKAVYNADMVLCTTPGARANFIARYPGIEQTKFRYITMGFDSEDFDSITPQKIFPDKFQLTLLGTFHTQIEPDGFWISPLHIFNALKIIKEKHPEKAENIRFAIVGHLIDKLYSLIEECNIQEMVHVTGYLPHREALAKASGSDTLLLVLYSKGRGPRHLPAKTFEYLAMKKPILALTTKDSDVAKIVLDTSTGVIVPPEDDDAIVQAILKLYDQYGKKYPIADFDDKEIARYHQSAKTGQLMRILDEVSDNGKNRYHRYYKSKN